MGHPPAAVWDYSPRQTDAFLIFASRRKQREYRESLDLHFLASRGDPKDVTRVLRGGR